MRDSVDIDLALHENRCEQHDARRAAEHNADSQNDDALFQEKVADARRRFLIDGTNWALRGVK